MIDLEHVIGKTTKSENVKIAFIAVNVVATFFTSVAVFIFFTQVIVRTCLLVKRKRKNDAITERMKEGTIFRRSIRMLVFLHIHSLLFSLNFFFAVFFEYYSSMRYFCVFQGWLGTWCGVKINLIILFIGMWVLGEFVIFNRQVFVSEVVKTNLEIASYLLIELTASLQAFLPGVFHAYGRKRYWCWIVDPAWQFGVFYIPMWIIFVFIFVTYTTSIIFLLNTFSKKFVNIFLGKHNSKPLAYITKLIFYPLAWCCIWIQPTIRRVLLIFKIDTITMALIHVFLMNTFGAYFVILYFVNNKLVDFCCVKSPLMRGFIRWSKRRPENENEKTSILLSFSKNLGHDRIDYYIEKEGQEDTS